MMAALGRLGSADAVQRLMRIAQSPTLDASRPVAADDRGLAPRPRWARIAALEALVDARGDAVASIVESMTADQDPMVASVARGLR
jgi:hypothetical protein